MAKIDFLKKGLTDSEEEKSKDLADANKEIHKKKKESKTLEKNAKKKQKELKKKEKKALHSKKKVKPNKSKKTLGGKKPYDWSEETKSEYGENKETYIQLHVESDQSFKELLLDIYFDENAPNFFTNENKMRWRPTADEMDSILEAFDILSQSSVSLEKKIDKLSKEFYFNPEKIEVEPPTLDSEQKEIDISPMSGDVFNKEQEQGSEDLKKNKEDGTLVNLEKKTDDLSESDKLSAVFITPPKKSTETEDVFPESREAKEDNENKEDGTLVNLEKKTDDLSESDKLSAVFKTPSEESPKIEEVVFNPEKIEVEPYTSDSEQKEIDTTPTNLEKKTDDLSESDELIEVFITPPKKSTETEDVFPESREAKEDNENMGGKPPTNWEKKTDDHSEESSKIEEVFITSPKKSTEPNDFSPKFNKIGRGNENKEDTTPTNLEKKTDNYPEESPKIEEVVFNPEKIEVEPYTSDSKQEEIDGRPRLDKVLFRRVEKT